MAAPLIVTVTANAVALVRVTEFTVIPAPENDTDEFAQAPATKFVPFTVTAWLVAPCAPLAGLS